jgi:16S rRNA processing protein RimM
MAGVMKDELTKVGKIGRPHGLRGELKVGIDEMYFQDVIQQDSLLIAVGNQYIPHFVEAWRSGGNLVKLEEIDDKESAQMLQQRDIYLPAHLLTIPTEDIPDDNPFEQYLGYLITDTEIGPIGKIQEIIDLPEHYLAEVSYKGKSIMIPMHTDLIEEVHEQEQVLLMDLPEGLLEL